MYGLTQKETICLATRGQKMVHFLGAGYRSG